MNHCQKLVGMLGCATSVVVHRIGGSTRTLISSSHVASSSPIVEEEDGEYDEDEEDEEQAEGEEEGVARRSTTTRTNLHPLSQPRTRGENNQRSTDIVLPRSRRSVLLVTQTIR